MPNKSDIDLSGVPSWARSVLEGTLEPEVPESALTYREDAAWPLLVEAAVVNTFLPQELAPEAVQSEKRSDAEQVVLNFAETSRTLDGTSQWSLKDETRAEVIKATIHTSSLQQAIDRTAEVFQDAASEALRNFLSDKPATKSLDLNSLEATRFAVSSLSRLLSDLPEFGDVNISRLDREIEYLRLMRVFERMVGRRSNPDGTEPVDRFYGRDEEIEVLRAYVGVVEADSFKNQLRRGVNWLTRTISGRAPLVIWGVGGAGKTTLVSKFMLEHAEAASGRFPFAYLDFDRNTISARRPSGLLMEMCQQVGSQFSQLTEPMAELNSRIAILARSFDVSTEFESSTYLTSFTQEFRKLVDDFLSEDESRFSRRPFLLVFDTFEVVQYTNDDVINLEEFVSGFSNPDDNLSWSRLRLIISGRKSIDSFLGDVERLELGALDAGGSKDMVIALAGDAGKTVSDREARALVSAIAKVLKEPTGGVQPLRLKLIGNLFETEDDDGATIVRSLLDELSKPLEKGGLAASVLVDGILVRRVLEHIRDDRVKALADPGLVVRRITPEVIKEVMTPATTDPSMKEPEGSDEPPSPPWVVDEVEAQSIFGEFGKEGTLVERDSFPGADAAGAAWRHRPDVRRQMLPLIALRRPNRFALVHKLAFDHFRREVETKRKEGENEGPSAAEAIYHGLWLDRDPKEIEWFWPHDPDFDPRIDADEFAKGSRANVYLRAKAGDKLQVKDLGQLPHPLVLQWFRRRSPDLLEERRIENAIKTIRSVSGPNYEALRDDPGTASVLCRLLYRAGRWDECYGLALTYLTRPGMEDITNPDEESRARKVSDVVPLLSLFRTAITVEAKSGTPGVLQRRVFEIASRIADPITAVELSSHAVLASTVTKWHQEFLKTFEPLLNERCRSIYLPTWQLEQRILRVAVIATARKDLLYDWVSLRDRIPRECGVPSIIDMLNKGLRGRESYKAVEQLAKDFHKEQRLTLIWNRIDALWREEKPAILEALKAGELLNDCWQLLLHEHSDWLRTFGNSLTRWLQSKEGRPLLDELDATGYWNRKTRTKQRREHDGVGIVQAAADEGRLLELAQLLTNQSERFGKRFTQKQAMTYPQDVFDVASALLRWQALIENCPRPQ